MQPTTITGDLMGKSVNVGIVGMGKMGIMHAGLLNSFEDVQVRAVADTQDLILNFIGQQFPSIQTYKNYTDMLRNEQLDLVFITTPTSFHTQIGLDCIKAETPFFVEKPLGISAKDCVPLIEAISSKPVINMIGYSKRYVDTFRKAKEVIEEGSLGELTYFDATMYVSQLFSKGKGWRYKKEASGGGVLNTLATHLVDLLLWYFGRVASVEGNTKSYYSKDVEDFAHAYIRFESGLEGHLDTSWSVRNYRLPEIKIEVHGEKGMLSVTEEYVKYYSDDTARWTTLFKQDLYAGVEFDLGGPEYTLEDKHIIECVQNNKSADVSVFEGYIVQRVIDAIYRSAEERRSISGDLI